MMHLHSLFDDEGRCPKFSTRRHLFIFFFLMIRRPPTPTLFPSPTLSRPLTTEQVTDPPAAPACSGKTSRAVRARLNAASAAVFFMASLPCKRTFRAPAEDPSCAGTRSEEHTSELQSQSNLVCRLLLEKKK